MNIVSFWFISVTRYPRLTDLSGQSAGPNQEAVADSMVLNPLMVNFMTTLGNKREWL